VKEWIFAVLETQVRLTTERVARALRQLLVQDIDGVGDVLERI